VSVRDPERRFLPFTFEADLPFRGLFELPCESPPHSPLAGRVGALPVFSTAWRPIPAGATVARAQLVDAVTGKPAASALLEVTVAGATFRGLADARGNVVVVLPYPEPAGSIGSPPGGTAVPFTQQRWPVTVACSYGRVGSPPDPPDLCHVLEQPPAALDVAGPLELAYGRELVLRAAAGSEVHVTPAVSPP
jgi:hypothetical protein